MWLRMSSECIKLGYGGETGIRTLDTLSSMPPFQGGTFNHSAISPHDFARLFESTTIDARRSKRQPRELAR